MFCSVKPGLYLFSYLNFHPDYVYNHINYSVPVTIELTYEAPKYLLLLNPYPANVENMVSS
jgi:hypothetical protein